MRDTLITLAVTAVPLICAIMAAVQAYRGKAGWGWFLFAALATTSDIHIRL